MRPLVGARDGEGLPQRPERVRGVLPLIRCSTSNMDASAGGRYHPVQVIGDVACHGEIGKGVGRLGVGSDADFVEETGRFEVDGCDQVSRRKTRLAEARFGGGGVASEDGGLRRRGGVRREGDDEGAELGGKGALGAASR